MSISMNTVPFCQIQIAPLNDFSHSPFMAIGVLFGGSDENGSDIQTEKRTTMGDDSFPVWEERLL